MRRDSARMGWHPWDGLAGPGSVRLIEKSKFEQDPLIGRNRSLDPVFSAYLQYKRECLVDREALVFKSNEKTRISHVPTIFF